MQNAVAPKIGFVVMGLLYGIGILPAQAGSNQDRQYYQQQELHQNDFQQHLQNPQNQLERQTQERQDADQWLLDRQQNYPEAANTPEKDKIERLQKLYPSPSH